MSSQRSKVPSLGGSASGKQLLAVTLDNTALIPVFFFYFSKTQRIMLTAKKLNDGQSLTSAYLHPEGMLGEDKELQQEFQQLVKGEIEMFKAIAKGEGVSELLSHILSAVAKTAMQLDSSDINDLI